MSLFRGHSITSLAVRAMAAQLRSQVPEGERRGELNEYFEAAEARINELSNMELLELLESIDAPD